MKSIRPQHHAPLSAPPPRPKLGKIIVRFALLLAAIVAIMLFIANR